MGGNGDNHPPWAIYADRPGVIRWWGTMAGYAVASLVILGGAVAKR